jgi:hypothetical protein
MKKSGRILITADLASEYGFTDVNGKWRECCVDIRSVRCARKTPYFCMWTVIELDLKGKFPSVSIVSGILA